jgi:hypothetical protein
MGILALKIGALHRAPIDKIAIFSKMAETTAMKFQQFVGAVSLIITAWTISSLQ